MILDGKKVRDEILENIKKEIVENRYEMTLAIIFVGTFAPSEVYVKNKIECCKKVGINTRLYRMEESSESEIIEIIEKLNNDENVTGIILQSPVPENIDIDACIKHIDPKKDVDGFTKDNFYKLAHGIPCLRPCTAKGIIRLLEHYNISLSGKNVCIIGRGNLVGKPLLFEMLKKDATVTICHTKTKDLKSITLNSDIIVCGAGSPHILTNDMVKEGSIIIDAGITIENGKVIGDADYLSLKDKCAYITPNPGGVGPMTIAMIMENVLEAYKGGNV